MAEAVAERVRRYILDGSDEDLRRLLGIAGDRVDDLVRDIRTAKDGGYEWVTSPFYLDLALRKV